MTMFPSQSGPMVPGLAPAEANERLSIFQARFDELWRRHETCSGGERLFGLAVNEYPELQQTKRELNLLQKLYGLYSTVNSSIDSYYDLLWLDVDIEKINNDLIDFQNRYTHGLKTRACIHFSVNTYIPYILNVKRANTLCTV